MRKEINIMKTTKTKIKWVLIITIILLWLVPLVKNEVLTVLYGSQFEGRQAETGLIGEVEYLKVITYTKDKAEVYYVAEEYSSGNVLIFRKNRNGQWDFDGWKTIWSSSGSASETLWPYFWHIIYGGI